MAQLSMTFGDVQIRLDRMDNDPLLLLDKMVDWEQFRPRLERIWRRCRSQHPAGRKPFDAVLMFKIIILGVRNRASDFHVQEMIKVRNDGRRFLHLHDADESPDEKTIWKYRYELAGSGEMEGLFDDYTGQMDAAGYPPKDGQLVDSSWVPAPKQRNTWAENAALQKGEMPDGWENQPHKLRPKDMDATWSRKNRQWVYGYKNHVNVDRCYKLIRRYVVTTAATQDLTPFESLILPTDTCRGVWADRAYSAAGVEAWLNDRGYDNPIVRRETRKRPYDECERQANQRRTRVRARVEHVLGAIRTQLGGPEVRAQGLTRVRCLVGLKNLLYNMHRFIQLERSASAMS